MKDLQEIVDKVKNTEERVDNLIIPLLKDTIADSNLHNKRSHILNIILAIMLAIVSVSSIIIIAEQNKKYAEFLSQFEFESETVYQSTNDYSDINSGINITK